MAGIAGPGLARVAPLGLSLPCGYIGNIGYGMAEEPEYRLEVEKWCCWDWTAYVERGNTREIRAARLKECQAEWRDAVKRHVECVFRVAKEARRVARENARGR